MNGGDIAKAGIGGGAGQAAKTLSDYYIKRAEQYHPIIPIGAGNEVTMVFQDGFQLETIAEAALKKANKAPVPQQDDVLADPTVARSFKDMKVGDLVDPHSINEDNHHETIFMPVRVLCPAGRVCG